MGMLKRVLLVMIAMLFAVSGMCMAAPAFLSDIAVSRQVIYVHYVGGTKGILDAWERVDDSWVERYGTVPVVLGANGVAQIGQKIEGDGKTPRGLYNLGMAFGYASLPGVKMPYQVMDENDYWVDEPLSPMYNRLVRGKPANGSYEVMRRQDVQYKLGILVEYNTQPVVPVKGSAIFMHVWLNKDAVTSGCIAMEESKLKDILLWLDPAKNPMIMIY